MILIRNIFNTKILYSVQQAFYWEYGFYLRCCRNGVVPDRHELKLN